jgi:hypothetical protein
MGYDPRLVHHIFSTIHPFLDNGREKDDAEMAMAGINTHMPIAEFVGNEWACAETRIELD